MVNDAHNTIDDHIKKLAHGPNRRVSCYKGYFINGFKFHTFGHGQFKAKANYGVCVSGSNYNEYDLDYYGLLEEIVELEYYGLGHPITLFKCHWYDTFDKGMKVHRLGLVEINYKSKLNTNDPFILAAQAQQVYYVAFPSMTKERRDWRVVCKIKARSKVSIPLVDVQEDDNAILSVEAVFQENETSAPRSIIVIDEAEDANVEVNIDVEELELEEIEELRHVMSLNKTTMEKEENSDDSLEQEVQESEYYNSDTTDNDNRGYDSNSSDNLMSIDD